MTRVSSEKGSTVQTLPPLIQNAQASLDEVTGIFQRGMTLGDTPAFRRACGHFESLDLAVDSPEKRALLTKIDTVMYNFLKEKGKISCYSRFFGPSYLEQALGMFKNAEQARSTIWLSGFG